MSNETLSIILVDDNPGDRLLAIRELSQEFTDLQTDEITDRASFEQALAEGRFDIAITDYQLHWGNGLQVLREIKDRFPDCPVIMFTNSSNGELAARAMKSGLDDYVTKSPRQYVRLAGAVRTIRELSLVSRRAHRLEMRLHSLLNQLDVGVFRVTLAGRLIETNAAFLRLLGLQSIEQAEASRFQDLYRLPLEQTNHWEREVRIERSDGHVLWVRLSAAFGSEAGEIVLDGLIEDVTMIRQIEEERRQASETLERRVRERTIQLEIVNQDLEAFSYSVSHDLREPLRNMQGLAQALLEDFGDQVTPTARQYAQLIVSSGQQMDMLIQDLLTYSRLGRVDLQLQPINLDSVVVNVLSQMESKFQQQNARVEVETPLPQVIGHYNTLVQIVLNLVSNGMKFVVAGVRPEVRIRSEEREEGLWVRLWVEDNGIGIPEIEHQRIFRVFERLHGVETYPGTGIGLAIVRRGIEHLGGRVGLDSVVGQGSRFWIELPKWTATG